MDTRGGKREGAGRKSISPEELRVQFSVSVKPETRIKASILREHGIRLGQEIDKLVNQLIQELEIKK